MVLEGGDGFSERLRQRFDIVGFDPRGIGSSNPLRCFDSNAEQNDFLAEQLFFPYQRDQERPVFDHYNDLTDRCLARGGDIRPHMSTADVARDMELLRQAVGDDELNYLGFSYGSYLGNTYANLFPDRIRALVIDGVLDPIAWSAGAHLVYDQTSTQRVLEEFFRLCDAAGEAGCAFAGAEPSQVRYERLANRLAESPVE